MPPASQEHIDTPTLKIDDRDRGLNCDSAMYSSLMTLVEKAEGSGWNGDEVALSMLRFSLAHLKARKANRETADATLREVAAELAATLGRGRMVDTLIRQNAFEAVQRSSLTASQDWFEIVGHCPGAAST